MWPAAPGPTQEGIPYDSIGWVLQKTDQYCTDMAKAASIPLARFYALNSAVETNCAGYGRETLTVSPSGGIQIRY